MKFEGEIGDIDLIRTVLELAHGSFTGAIRFERDDIIKILYLREGQFLSASTNDRGDSLDEILLRSNKISKEHIRQALAKRREGESLGDALLNLGFVTRRELVWVRRMQLVGVLRSLIGWQEGSYQVVSDYLPQRDEGTLFPVPQIITELLVTSEDRGAAEAAMAGGTALFGIAPGGEEIFADLGLNEDAEAVFRAVGGGSTAAEVAASVPLDEFAVYKLLNALQIVGAIDKAPAAASAALDDDLDWEAEPALPAVGVDPGSSSGTAAGEPLPDLDLGYRDDDVLQIEPDAGPESESWDSSGFAEDRDTRGSDPSFGIPEPAAPRRAAPTRRSRRSPLPILIIVLAVLALAAAVWWFVSSRPVTAPEQSAEPAPAVLAAEEEIEVESIPEPDATGTDQSSVSVLAPNTETAASAVAIEAASDASTVAWSWQVAFVCEDASLQGAIRQGGDEVWFMPVERGGSTCNRIFWGRFDDLASARRAEEQIPAYFRDAGQPIVVSPRSMVQ